MLNDVSGTRQTAPQLRPQTGDSCLRNQSKKDTYWCPFCFGCVASVGLPRLVMSPTSVARWGNAPNAVGDRYNEAHFPQRSNFFAEANKRRRIKIREPQGGTGVMVCRNFKKTARILRMKQRGAFPAAVEKIKHLRMCRFFRAPQTGNNSEAPHRGPRNEQREFWGTRDCGG